MLRKWNMYKSIPRKMTNNNLPQGLIKNKISQYIQTRNLNSNLNEALTKQAPKIKGKVNQSTEKAKASYYQLKKENI